MTAILALIALTLPWSVPWRISFVVAMVIVVGAIFVSTHGTTAPRKMAAATDEAETPISTAGKRWDTTTPLAWRWCKDNQSNVTTSRHVEGRRRVKRWCKVAW
jgi:hypothetical protein